MGLTRILLIAAIAVAGYLVWRRVQVFLDGRPDKGKVAKGGNDRQLRDMEKCPVCDTYVAVGVGRCQRPDCPRR
jgi:hypothetical protein